MKQEERLQLVVKLEALRQKAIERMEFENAMTLRDAKYEVLTAAKALPHRKAWEAATFKAFEETMDPFFAGWYLDVLHRVGA
jgi:hypothetical protein